MSNRHVVFIHGIGPQQKGYSDKLWQEMGRCGDLSGVVRHEMLYSDVFAVMNAKISELSSSADISAWVKKVLGGSAWAGLRMRTSRVICCGSEDRRRRR